ncbi:MAG: type II toxin-antitoxin system HicB family antitoxin [bacterium]|nr:type II toxin-antitoxin system HicB family antitoxin [bacterium]
MRNIIQFQISESDGGYVAEGVGVPIVTQGDTLDELTANIREAVGLYIKDENLAELGFATTPSVLVNFELPTLAHV